MTSALLLPASDHCLYTEQSSVPVYEILKSALSKGSRITNAAKHQDFLEFVLEFSTKELLDGVTCGLKLDKEAKLR
jgi:hypothetical protein